MPSRRQLQGSVRLRVDIDYLFLITNVSIYYFQFIALLNGLGYLSFSIPIVKALSNLATRDFSEAIKALRFGSDTWSKLSIR